MPRASSAASSPASFAGSGHEVVALVRDLGRATALADAGVELVEGDLDDVLALDRICAEVDGTFDAAGWYKVGAGTRKEGDRVNVEDRLPGARRKQRAASST